MSLPDYAMIGLLRALRKARPHAVKNYALSANTSASTIKQLQGLGFGIESHPVLGILLTADCDKLFPENIIAFRSPKYEQRPVYVFLETTSTQDAANRNLAAHAHDSDLFNGALWVAEKQTAGRGRYQRTWQSEPGQGCWFTIYLNACQKNSPATVSFSAALAVAEGIKKCTGLSCEFKWPNDVLVQSKKVCGILTEHSRCGRGMLVGIGVNVHHHTMDFQDEVRNIAISLAQASSTPLPEAVRPALIAAIADNLDQILSLPWKEIRNKWCAACPLFQKPIRLLQRNAVLHGIFHDIDDQGNLILRLDNGSHIPHISGEVQIL